jgi:hypothetical protein
MIEHEAIVPLVTALVEGGGGSGGGGGRRPRRHHPRRSARARLALDASALLAGLRHGVLLDYGGPAFQDEAGLCALAAGLSALLQRGCDGNNRGTGAAPTPPRIALARLRPRPCPDGADFGGPALFLVSLPLGGGVDPPWPVELSAHGPPRWGDAGARAALGAGLAALAAAAVDAVGPTAAIDLPGESVPHTAIAAWLLGYPVALMPADGGGGDGGGFGSTHLAAAARLVALRAAPPPGLAAALQDAGWPLPPGVLSCESGGDATAAVDVCSFALPDPGGPPGTTPDWLEETWVRGVRARAAGSGWTGLHARTGSLGDGGLAL